MRMFGKSKKAGVSRSLSVFAALVSALWLGAIVPSAHAGESSLDLKPYAGKIVYVDFWASWCVPCRASFPFMQELAAEFGEDLAVVAVNVDKKREQADTFLADFDVNFDIVYDPEGNIASEYELKGMPTTYLIDRDGNLVAEHIGFRTKDTGKLRQAVQAAIDF